jgi:GTP-binding protein Era
LLDIIEPHLPERPWTHDPDALTDRDERFLATEIVREKLFCLTGEELPYTSTVVLDRLSRVGCPGAATAARALRRGATQRAHRSDHRRRA